MTSRSKTAKKPSKLASKPRKAASKPRKTASKPRKTAPKPRKPAPKPRKPAPKPRKPAPKPRKPAPKPRKPAPKPFGLGMGEDATELQRKQDRLERSVAKLEAANRELQVFSDTLAQTLRDPLLIVTNFGHHLPEALGEQEAYDLERIRVAGLHMVHIVDDVRDLADASRVEIASGRVDLSLLARGIMADLRVRGPNRNVRFEAEPGIKARGDKTLLKLLMTNLLQNAWKYTEPRVDAWIELGVDENNGSVPTYHVRDNGIGFDNANREIIFESFERLHARTEFAGSGLGLTIVERIVRRHGGRVWAEGARGEGAVFRFTLKPPPIDPGYLGT